MPARAVLWMVSSASDREQGELVLIRAATRSDHSAVVPLILQAMEGLVHRVVGSANSRAAVDLFSHFFQLPENQYSFENTLVYVDDGQVVGSLVAYDGHMLEQYRRPFLAYLEEYFALTNFQLEDETEAGEYYLDSVSVAPGQQGRGIGKALIQAGIQQAKEQGFARVGLLVESGNPDAKRLYGRLGFEGAGMRSFAGGQYEHMVCRISEDSSTA